MNLFFGGPPEEPLKRQVGKKASGPDVNEKTGSKHNEIPRKLKSKATWATTR